MEITEAAVKELLADIADSKHSIRSAAAELDISPFVFQSTVQRFGLVIPPRKSIADRLTERFSSQELSAISGRELARQLGCSQPAVRKALIGLGINSKYRERRKQGQESKCEAIIEHIRENGGTVRSARAALGVAVDLQVVRNYAKSVGFNLDKYRLAYQQFGYWIIQPSVPKPCYTADYRVTALCTRCGTVHENVMVTNLRAGSSQGCSFCVNKQTAGTKVRCLETGRIYRSIRSFCQSVEQFVHYQTIRLKLRRAGRVSIDGLTYVLTN